jgi:hypothetical protein
MPRRTWIGIALAIGVLAALWWWRGGRHTTSSTPVGTGSATEAHTGTAPASRPPAHVTQLAPEDRQRLADRIAAAQAARKAHPVHAAPPAPSLPPVEAPHDLDHVQADVLQAMKEAIPFLAACYKEHAPSSAKAGLTAVAQMTLTGDPDIGTVVDADQIYDDRHQPLAKDLDDCLRATMQTLALPPLEEGDTVRIQYSFAFDD